MVLQRHKIHRRLHNQQHFYRRRNKPAEHSMIMDSLRKHTFFHRLSSLLCPILKEDF